MTMLLRANRNFRLLISANAVSNLGDGVAMVALPWLATFLTRDPLLISAVAAAQRLPWFLFALPAGVWTDRQDRRQLMLRADILRMGLILCILAMALSTPQVMPAETTLGPILLLIALAFLLGIAEVLRDNAAQTVLPSIVPHDKLEQANGQLWSAEHVTGHFIGPPLAGLLIGAGLALPFGVDALAYGVSAGLLWLIVLPPRARAPSARFWSALREGIAWMRGNPAILRLALMLGVINAVFVGGMSVMVLYAQEVLGLTAVGYGLLLTCGAVGGVLGGLIAPQVALRLGARNALLLALGLFAAVQAVFALTGAATLAATALFIEGMASMLWNTVTVSYRQRRIPDALLGRVNSVYRFFGWGAMPFGALGAGALVVLAEGAVSRDAALHLPYAVAALSCAGLWIYALMRMRLD